MFQEFTTKSGKQHYDNLKKKENRMQWITVYMCIYIYTIEVKNKNYEF